MACFALLLCVQTLAQTREREVVGVDGGELVNRGARGRLVFAEQGGGGQVLQRLLVLRIDGERLAILFDGAGVVGRRAPVERVAEICLHVCVLRLDGEDALIIFGRAREVALVILRVAHTGQRLHVFRFDGERALQI